MKLNSQAGIPFQLISKGAGLYRYAQFQLLDLSPVDPVKSLFRIILKNKSKEFTCCKNDIEKKY
jgi:hypothetical protein